MASLNSATVTGIALVLTGLLGSPAQGSSTVFDTGSPDGLMAALSQPAASGAEYETADDFILATTTTTLDGATFTGLIPTGSTVEGVTVEIYRIFPLDTDTTRNPEVVTRLNSPSDVMLTSRNSSDGSLAFSDTELSPSFTAANSVQFNGVHPKPGQMTGGSGPVTGEETTFDITFATPLTLTGGHYFFVPQVQLDDDNSFFWLSAPKPIEEAPGIPFPSGVTDLQGWIRDANLDPDWSRIGTDIVGNGSFNFAFSLSAVDAVPEPTTWSVMLVGFLCLGTAVRGRANGRPSSLTSG
jgi:hypothetical protein